MIIVKKDYYYIYELINYIKKHHNLREYKRLLPVLINLRNNNEEYLSATTFFHDSLKDIKKDLTDLSGYFGVDYLKFSNKPQKSRVVEYFTCKKPKYCRSFSATHLYNEKVNPLLEDGYIINVLGYAHKINKLQTKDKELMILSYNKIIVLENKFNKKERKLFLGAWK